MTITTQFVLNSQYQQSTATSSAIRGRTLLLQGDNDKNWSIIFTLIRWNYN